MKQLVTTILLIIAKCYAIADEPSIDTDPPYLNSSSALADQQHGGWLGKPILQIGGSYGWPSGGTPTAPLRVSQEPLYSFYATASRPAPWSHKGPQWLQQDLFVAGRWSDWSETHYMGAGDSIGDSVSVDVSDGSTTLDSLLDVTPGNVEVRPTYFEVGKFQATRGEISLGTTIYGEVLPFIRPFMQVGYRYRRIETASPRLTTRLSNPRAGIFSQPTIIAHYETQDEHSVIGAIGFEADFSTSTTIRSRVEFDSKRSSTGTVWSIDFVHWPSDDWFFHAGYFDDLENKFAGLSLGTGISF